MTSIKYLRGTTKKVDGSHCIGSVSENTSHEEEEVGEPRGCDYSINSEH